MNNQRKKLAKQNNQNGITLVALVITIIVLVILVGVAISVVLNTNLINNSKSAVTEYSEAQKLEEQQIADYEQQILDYELMRDLKEDSPLESSGGATSNVMTEEGPMTVEEVLDQYPEDAGYALYPLDGIVVTEEGGERKDNKITDLTIKVTTGMIIGKNGKEMSRIVIYGDVNCDGEIGSADASQIALYLSKMEKGEKWDFKDYQKQASDVNHDGVISLDDVNLVTKVAASYITIQQNVPATIASSLRAENRYLFPTMTADLKAINSEYIVSNGYLINIKPNTIAKNLNLPVGYGIWTNVEGEADENITGTGEIVKTGMIVQKDGLEIAIVIIFGDVDCNGTVTTQDCMTILNSEQRLTFETYQKVAADVNGDGTLDVRDTTDIQKMSLDSTLKGIQYIVNHPEKIRYNYGIAIQIRDNLKEGATYTFKRDSSLDDYVLQGIPAGKDVEELLEEIPGLVVYDSEGEEKGEGDTIVAGDYLYYQVEYKGQTLQANIQYVLQ